MSEHDHPDIGSLGEEAAKLAEALQDWAGHNIADGSASCRLCPLCQAIALVRERNPEAVDEIGEQVQGLVRSVRGLVESFAGSGGGRRDPGVQKIKLSDDEVSDDEEGGIPWE